MTAHAKEVDAATRFEFGANWNRFLSVLDEERIEEAENSLKDMLEVDSLEGKALLDIGSGSGLFSLAARRLGAIVHSFDYDPQSVACTAELKRRYFPDHSKWSVEEGSVLDRDYLASLGQHDVVYSWGVLHHTGDLWTALDNVVPLVRTGGRLFIAIYNDQGPFSRFYARLKKTYVNASRPGKIAIAGAYMTYHVVRGLVADTLVRRRNPIKRYSRHNRARGMSAWHDIIDWIGGYPFEVAKPEHIFDFYREQGFTLRRLKTCVGGSGCNEFVFEKTVEATSSHR